MRAYCAMFLVLLFVGLADSCPARADVFDRIDQCERSGGGACVYNLLRELARSGHGGHGTLLDAGTYRSDSYVVTVSATRSSVTLTGDSSIGERGTYNCSGTSCTSSSHGHRIDILGDRQFQVTYSGNGSTRIWSHE